MRMYLNWPRLSLGNFPTPLHELKNLSLLLGGPSIFVKRDDLTGLALGGNKVRKLEYILADARAQNAEVIITIGATTSNHARQTAAAAAVLGLECQLVLIGRQPQIEQGNYLLDHLLGASTFCVRSKDVDAKVSELMEGNARQGKKSYLIPAGGHNVLGAGAYYDAYQEIMEQCSLPVDLIVTAIGTGTTFAGLHTASQAAGSATRICGITVGGDKDWCIRETLAASHQLEDLLGLSPSRADDLLIFDQYIGDGYTIPYPRLRDIIKLLARTEGILLDPVYSGKAMVGLVDLIETGYFTKGQNVVFLHTGGAPELFTMNTFLSE